MQLLYTVGIDPGFKGGISFYNGNDLKAYRTPIYTVPFVKKGKKSTRNEMDLEFIRDELFPMPFRKEIRHVFLEQVNAMPGQGVTGMFRFGQNLGQWQGVITGLGLPLTMIRPQVWKSHVNLIGSDKESSIDLARELWSDHAPTLFKYKKADEGRAEAALIAKYGYETLEAENV
jgi:crossover junction endodeoxyribonuclease RuvC